MCNKLKHVKIKEMRAKIMGIKPYLIVVFIPIFFTLLFGGVMSPIFVENVSVAIYDMDQSATSREVIDYFYDCPSLKITEDISSTEDLKEKMMLGEVRGGIIIPKDFGKDLRGKKGAQALVLMDGSNFMYSNNVMLFVNTIFSTINAGVQMSFLEAGSLVPYQAEQSVYTLNLVDRVLYNPQLGYLYYLFGLLIAVFIQQTFLAAGVPFLIEEKNRLKELPIKMDRSFIKVRMSLMVRRFLLIGGLSIISSLICIHIASVLFGYPMRGNVLLLVLFQVVFMGAMTGMALAIATVFDQASHAVQFTMFLAVPTSLSCGYGWPEYMMAPGFGAVIKAIWPLYYYANPIKDIMLKGVGLEVLYPYIIGGSLFAAVWIPLGLLLFGRKIRIIRTLHH